MARIKKVLFPGRHKLDRITGGDLRSKDRVVTVTVRDELTGEEWQFERVKLLTTPRV